MESISSRPTEPDVVPLLPRPVELTEKAASMVQKAMHEEGLDAAALRVGVYGGGCAGLQYLLDFTERPSDTDFVFEHRGIKLVVDQFSAGHLRGTTINYVEGPAATGFKFDNPNLVRSCGCGLAF